MNSDITPPEVENVVALNADSERELEIRRAIQSKALQCPGRHKSVEVDSEKRILVCKHCGFVVDPFDYIEQWAIEGDRRMTGLKGIQNKTKIASSELADLERKLRNVRAQLRRAGSPQTHEERLIYDRQRWNALSTGTMPTIINGGLNSSHDRAH